MKFSQYFTLYTEATEEAIKSIKKAIDNVGTRPFPELFGKLERFAVKVYSGELLDAGERLGMDVKKVDWKKREYQGKNINSVIKQIRDDRMSKEANSGQSWSGTMDEQAWRTLKKHIDQNDLYLYYVYSRHPIDVLRMSDHRRITSCHNLKTGSLSHCAYMEAENGGGIVYIVKESDFNRVAHKLNSAKEIWYDADRNIDGIEPLARIRLRRFIDIEEEDDFAAADLRYYRKDGNVMGHYGKYTKEITLFLQTHQHIFSEKISNEYIANNIYLMGGTYTDDSVSQILSEFFGKRIQVDDDTRHIAHSSARVTAFKEKDFYELIHKKNWKKEFNKFSLLDKLRILVFAVKEKDAALEDIIHEMFMKVYNTTTYLDAAELKAMDSELFKYLWTHESPEKALIFWNLVVSNGNISEKIYEFLNKPENAGQMFQEVKNYMLNGKTSYWNIWGAFLSQVDNSMVNSWPQKVIDFILSLNMEKLHHGSDDNYPKRIAHILNLIFWSGKTPLKDINELSTGEIELLLNEWSFGSIGSSTEKQQICDLYENKFKNFKGKLDKKWGYAFYRYKHHLSYLLITLGNEQKPIITKCITDTLLTANAVIMRNLLRDESFANIEHILSPSQIKEICKHIEDKNIWENGVLHAVMGYNSLHPTLVFFAEHNSNIILNSFTQVCNSFMPHRDRIFDNVESTSSGERKGAWGVLMAIARASSRLNRQEIWNVSLALQELYVKIMTPHENKAIKDLSNGPQDLYSKSVLNNYKFELYDRFEVFMKNNSQKIIGPVLDARIKELIATIDNMIEVQSNASKK